MENQGQRRCCRCRQIKSLETDFKPHPLSRRGRDYACRQCLSPVPSAPPPPREPVPDSIRPVPPGARRLCTRCRGLKLIQTEFEVDPAGPRQRSEKCRACPSRGRLRVED
jgi:hypothetical protein